MYTNFCLLTSLSGKSEYVHDYKDICIYVTFIEKKKKTTENFYSVPKIVGKELLEFCFRL